MIGHVHAIKRKQLVIDGTTYNLPPRPAERLPLAELRPGKPLRVEASPHGVVMLTVAVP
jgi:hypothetical protein